MHWFVGFCGTLLGFVDHSDILWIADAEVLLISVRSPLHLFSADRASHYIYILYMWFLLISDHYVFKDRGFCSPAFIFRFILFVYRSAFFFLCFFCND